MRRSVRTGRAIEIEFGSTSGEVRQANERMTNALKTHCGMEVVKLGTITLSRHVRIFLIGRIQCALSVRMCLSCQSGEILLLLIRLDIVAPNFLQMKVQVLDI